MEIKIMEIKNVDEEQLEEILDEFIDNNNFEKSINCENEKLLFIKIIKRQAKNVIDKICEKILNSFVTLCDNIYFNEVIKALLPNCSENNYDLMFIKCCVNIYEISKGRYGYSITNFLSKIKKEEILIC